MKNTILTPGPMLLRIYDCRLWKEEDKLLCSYHTSYQTCFYFTKVVNYKRKMNEALDDSIKLQL